MFVEFEREHGETSFNGYGSSKRDEVRSESQRVNNHRSYKEEARDLI